MSLIQCSVCRMNTLSTQGSCQYCGKRLKASIWKRKMRRREAYGILLIVIGLSMLQWMKGPGVVTVLVGIGLISFSFFTHRVRQ